jgi:hypothetical protein
MDKCTVMVLLTTQTVSSMKEISKMGKNMGMGWKPIHKINLNIEDNGQWTRKKNLVESIIVKKKFNIVNNLVQS